MMKSMLLVSADQELRARIQRAFAGEERLILWRTGSTLPQKTDASGPWIVVDCRTKDGNAVIAEFASIRDYLGEHVRCAAIVSGLTRVNIEVIASIGSRPMELILADSDSVADMLRALLNDSTETTAAAIALALLLKHLPDRTHEIVRCVLGSGLQASSVKEVAAAKHQDRSELGRGLRETCGWTATELVDLAKASYVAVLLHEQSLPLSAVVKAARFRERRWLDALLERVFHLTAAGLRARRDDGDPGVFLDQLLAGR